MREIDGGETYRVRWGRSCTEEPSNMGRVARKVGKKREAATDQSLKRCTYLRKDTIKEMVCPQIN